MVDCKNALQEANGDTQAAIELLRKKGALKAAKKSAERTASEGIVHAYIHANQKVGVLIELQCESDFVARNPEFLELAHDIAMQVAATDPKWVAVEEIPEDAIAEQKRLYALELAEDKKPDDIKQKIMEGKLAKWYEETVLLKQPWVKDDTKTIAQLIEEKVATIGEKMVLARFTRMALSAPPKPAEQDVCI